MSNPYLLVTLILFLSCSAKTEQVVELIEEANVQEVVVPELQYILDSAQVKGAILLYDLANNTYYSNDLKWSKKGHLPASTFKIPNSMIALETGVVKNDSILFEWNGQQRSFEVWEQDLQFRDAFRYSCVPCYQEVAREIGVENMNKFLNELDYGTMSVDSTNLDVFWLEGASRITQFEQIDFLKRLYYSELPISDRTETIIKRMMVIENIGEYQLRGKTGWSINNGHHNGWFVGYIENETQTYFFATNVEPSQELDMDLFPMIRTEVTIKALERMKMLE